MERAYRINADVIEALRKQRALSWGKLAEKAEVDVKTLRRWRKGEPAYMENIARLAEALRVEPKTLMDDIPSPEPSPSPQPSNQHFMFTFDTETFRQFIASAAANADRRRLQKMHDRLYVASKDDPYREEFYNLVNYYYVPIVDPEHRQTTYHLVVALAGRHKEAMKALHNGKIPAFAVTLWSGLEHARPDWVKEGIQSEYVYKLRV